MTRDLSNYPADAERFARATADPDDDRLDRDEPDPDQGQRIGTSCWNCNGAGFVPTGLTDGRGEMVTRQCGACDGWGYR